MFEQWSRGERDGEAGEVDDLPVTTSPLDSVLSPRGPVTVHDVSAALDEAASLQARICALEAERLMAVERARRAAVRCEPALLAEEELEVQRAGTSRRHELAKRAFTADLATALRLSEHQASHLLDTARTLTRCGTATLDELARGRISAAHATAMADVLADLPDSQARLEVQAEVLSRAALTTLPQFRSSLRRARDRAHPEPFTSRHQKAAATRAVHVDPAADGMAWLSAFLPATSAHAAYDRLSEAGRSAKVHGDDRTLPQLRADALTALLLVGPTPGRPSDAGGDMAGDDAADVADGLMPDVADDQRDDVADVADGLVPDLADHARRITPRVQVTVPVMALLGRTDDAAELDGHGPIDPQVATLLAGAAPSLRRLLVDPVSGRILTSDPHTYSVPGALRDYLRARDGVCRFPGCRRAATGCDVDHTVAWAHGGRTTADNLAHLCRRHHVLKHQTRWRARQGPDGALVWTSPTGRVHHDSPAPPIDLTGLELLPADEPPAPPPAPSPPAPSVATPVGPPPF